MTYLPIFSKINKGQKKLRIIKIFIKLSQISNKFTIMQLHVQEYLNIWQERWQNGQIFKKKVKENDGIV